MRVDEFDFDLPEERIALRPASPRDASRLLVVRPGEAFEDRIFRDLPALLSPGDVLVFNDTRVIPAQLTGRRMGRGGAAPKISATLHMRAADDAWYAFAKPGRKLREGDKILFGMPGGACGADELWAEVAQKRAGGEILLKFDKTGPMLDEVIARVGEMPLPPYIAARRRPDLRDRRDYQTIFAERDGAVAAPTAGLHFTPELLEALKSRGVMTERVTLHVGAGTFLPVKAEDTDDHRMHAEYGEISGDTAERLNAARAQGARVVAVGTTSLRILESAADETGRIHPFAEATEIFITPGYRFRAVDALVTNFHLPRSTLFMLVSAFCGLETMKAAYAHAIANEYRFYSYGDSSLLFPQEGARLK